MLKTIWEFFSTLFIVTFVMLGLLVAMPYVMQEYDNHWCSENKLQCVYQDPALAAGLKTYPRPLEAVAEWIQEES